MSRNIWILKDAQFNYTKISISTCIPNSSPLRQISWDDRFIAENLLFFSIESPTTQVRPSLFDFCSSLYDFVRFCLSLFNFVLRRPQSYKVDCTCCMGRPPHKFVRLCPTLLNFFGLFSALVRLLFDLARLGTTLKASLQKSFLWENIGGIWPKFSVLGPYFCLFWL